MLTHVVLMKFKPGTEDAEIRELEKLLNDLPNKIMEIQMFEFGRDVLSSERSYDFALVALFANLPALERYQKHPDHLPVIAKIKAMSASLAAVDFYGSDGSATEAGAPEWERDPFERLKR
ncbi:MAG: Dabb family protein [Desulfobacterales bacterium]